MHGADFYASKRHKGEHFDSNDSNPESRHSLNHKRMQASTASTASKLLQLDSPGSNHPGAITSSGSPESANNSHNKNDPDCHLPISDNNVSTTNTTDTLMDEAETWENDADINVSNHTIYYIEIWFAD